jgi:cyclopropane-fatty-acyl-phospholipid synthase
MDAQAPIRGSELLGGGRIGIGPQWLARVCTGGVDRILRQIDQRLARGAIEAQLPDGRQIVLGGKASGFVARVELKSWRALLLLAAEGSIGAYQAWEDGNWTSPDPVSLFALFMDNASALGNVGRATGPWRVAAWLFHRLHRNSRNGAQRNIRAHYDLGNDFYAGWLDPTMSYSSARFDDGATELEAGQQRKIETVVQRVAGARSVLEIGCGWGSLSRHLADGGAAVTAISLSDEQLAWARERHGSRVHFRKQDYRDISGEFDAIVSVEMVEAVGQEYWPAFFDCITRCLKSGGKAALQYISIRDELFEAYAASADFIQAYVFPGGMLVRESRFRELAAERGLEWHDQTSFGIDYARTLRLWRGNFEEALHQGRLSKGFDDRFIRLWQFYLMYCEGGFCGRGIDVAQVTLIKR